MLLTMQMKDQYQIPNLVLHDHAKDKVRTVSEVKVEPKMEQVQDNYHNQSYNTNGQVNSKNYSQALTQSTESKL